MDLMKMKFSKPESPPPSSHRSISLSQTLKGSTSSTLQASGTVGGIDQDKKNFANTLDFLQCFDKISAVVVLLKPNNARLTVAFKFCVLELLTHLHKSLVSNIMFAFTNSRGTFYRPGDTLPALKKLLNEKQISIDVSKENYFCFDNEAFRYNYTTIT